jgi:hypothetical protein
MSDHIVIQSSGLRGPKGDPGPAGPGGGGGGGNVAVDTHAATGKSTPVNADEIPLVDSAASFGLKKITWANLVARVVATLTSSSVGLGNVDNTHDADKPISDDTQDALDLKVNIAGLLATIGGVYGGTGYGTTASAEYNTGSSAWPSLPSALTTDPATSWRFVGGDVSHAPPTVSGPATTWDRPT